MHTRAGVWLTPKRLAILSALTVASLAPPAFAGVDETGTSTTTTTSTSTSPTTTPPTTGPDDGPPPASPEVPPEELPPPPDLPPPAAEPAPVVVPPAADARLTTVTTDAGLQRQRVDGARERVAALQDELTALEARERRLRYRVRQRESLIPPANRRVRRAQSDVVDATVAAYQSGGDTPVQVLVAADDPIELKRLTKLASASADAAIEELEVAQRARAKAQDEAAAAAMAIPPVQAHIDEIAFEQLPAARGKQTKVERVAATPTAAPVSGLDIPVVTLDAYLRAETALAAEQPQCGIAWWALAGIGRIESNHARYGGSFPDVNGNVEPPIIGIALNGNGVAAIHDSDDGAYDGDTVWDRAVGPMQFIPTTWRGYAADGNGDGATNPHNVYDAAVAAARYLCRGGGGSLQTDDDLVRAFLAYNHSSEYAQRVLDYAHAYRDAGVTL